MKLISHPAGKLFEFRVLRTAVGPDTEELTAGGGKYTIKSLILHNYYESDEM
jgi:hypothetical protein